MTFKLAAFFALSWGLMAILGAFMELSATPADDDPTRQLLNAFSQPSSINISDPTLGEAQNQSTVAANFRDAAATATGWLGFMVQSATLDFPWWQGNLQVVRYLMLLLAAPFIFIVTREMFQVMMALFRGITGAVGQIAGVLSDERLKTNIEPLHVPGGALSAVRSLKPVQYDWKNEQENEHRAHLGLIAQDVETILPEAVGTVDGAGAGHPDIPDLRVLHLEALLAVVIATLQELDEKVARLEDRT